MNIGDFYEQKAIESLKKQGFQIILQNGRYKKAQVDIICSKNGIIYAVEVKYRYKSEFLEIKQEQLHRIESYMLTHYPGQFFNFFIIFFNRGKEEIIHVL